MPFPTWAFVVRPLAPGRSRLVVRFQSDYDPGWVTDLTNKWLVGPVHFVMERKMLLGIKERAERGALRRLGKIDDVVREGRP